MAQRFMKLTSGFKYPAVGGGEINSVELVENQQMPTFTDYIRSIPSLFAGDATLPKPIGADTKVPDLSINAWSICTITTLPRLWSAVGSWRA